MSYKYYVFTSCNKGLLSSSTAENKMVDWKATNVLEDLAGKGKSLVSQGTVYDKRNGMICTVWTVRRKNKYTNED